MTDLRSRHDRQHSDPPNLWLAVLAGSLIVHLLLLLSGRLFLFRVSSQKSAGVAAPIELVDLSPKSSSTTRSTRSAAPNVITDSAASQSAVSSEATPQRAAPIQPEIVQKPIPSPTPRLMPQTKPSIKPTIAAPTPKSQPPSSVKPVSPTVPETIVPDQATSSNPESAGSDTGDRLTSPESNSGSENPNNTPGAPDSSTNNLGNEPSASGAIGSNQPLLSELSVQSNIGQFVKSGSQTSGKSIALQDSPTQILSIQFPPALKLTPNQVLDLTVLVVVDNTSGKVLSSEALLESKAFQDIPGLNQEYLASVVNRIFQDLTFKVEVETGPGAIAPQSPWKVPVQIKVIN
ncbi:MAG: hypothetical protein LH660_03125 [Phormidesmis sp. CAN_BIN36]|nr:hypothetical protein [Phormidesmis sp. CAN_BIN36]